MDPIVNGLTDEFNESIEVYRLDAAQPEISQLQTRYGVRGHPSFVVVAEDNEVIARYLGPQDEATLRNSILEAIP